MPSVHVQSAEHVAFSALVAALNRAYSDYTIPIHVTEASLRAMFARDDIALANCAVAVEHGEVVGTGLLGVRGAQGWVGGMGVVPGKRGQGIGGQVLHHLLARARALGVQTLRLEVLEGNERAHALYRQHGFQDVRRLHMLERPPHKKATAPPQNTFHIAPAPPETLLEYYESFHDVRNCWQRARPSLERLAPHSQGWTLCHASAPSGGYILGQFTSYSVLVFDLATPTWLEGSQRLANKVALLAHLHRHFPHALGHAYNVAEDDPALGAYHALGYQTHLRQIEMELRLR